MGYNSVISKDGQVIGWDIQDFIDDEKNLEVAKLDWTKQSPNRPVLDVSYTHQNLDKEVEWVEALLNDILNIYCKKMRVTLFSKRW